MRQLSGSEAIRVMFVRSPLGPDVVRLFEDHKIPSVSLDQLKAVPYFPAFMCLRVHSAFVGRDTFGGTNKRQKGTTPIHVHIKIQSMSQSECKRKRTNDVNDILCTICIMCHKKTFECVIDRRRIYSFLFWAHSKRQWNIRWARDSCAICCASISCQTYALVDLPSPIDCVRYILAIAIAFKQ